MKLEREPTPTQMVAGLIAKRAEIANAIEALQHQVKAATGDLDRLEATLRLFKPDIDMSELSERPVPPQHAAFRGEVTRILFEALRAAKEPISTGDLTAILMKKRGLPLDDLKLRRTMLQRVGAILNHAKRVRGTVKSLQGPKKMLLWEVHETRIDSHRN